MTTHGPVMPIWICGGCNAPWPCPTRRRQLGAEFADAPVSLALYLGSYFVLAAEDLYWVPAGALHHRFLGWIREANQATPVVQQRSTATAPATPVLAEPQQAE